MKNIRKNVISPLMILLGATMIFLGMLLTPSLEPPSLPLIFWILIFSVDM
ncbi:MAG: hypothetical protein Q6362_008370 [Candidatus Wukongarchaeota archaeon]|nr:hypothetical protein [Candidatus Wukongarchaeota archaeon]